MARFGSLEEAIEAVRRWDRNGRRGALTFVKSDNCIEVYCKETAFASAMNDEQFAAFQSFIDAFGSVSIQVRAKYHNHKLVPDKVELFLP